MRFHKIEMIGKLVLQKVNDLPIFNFNRDQGRLIYNLSDNKTYQGSNSGWNIVGTDNKDSYNENFSLSNTWVVTHNLDSYNIIYQCFNSDNKMIIPNNITKNSENQITVDFGNSAVSGNIMIIKVN